MLLDAKDMNTFIELLLASDSDYMVGIDFFFLETNFLSQSRCVLVATFCKHT